MLECTVLVSLPCSHSACNSPVYFICIHIFLYAHGKHVYIVSTVFNGIHNSVQSEYVCKCLGGVCYGASNEREKERVHKHI